MLEESVNHNIDLFSTYLVICTLKPFLILTCIIMWHKNNTFLSV